MKTIDNLRQKPEHHRRKVALSVSFLISLAIFAVWSSVIFPSSVSKIAQKQEAKEESVESETPIAVLKDSVAQAYQAFKNLKSNSSTDLELEYNKIKDQVESGSLKIIPESTAR